MHMELPEVGMEAAQIVTETVIERDESEFSIFFSLPSVASSSMLNAALMPSRGDELNRKLYGKLQKPSKSGEQNGTMNGNA